MTGTCMFPSASALLSRLSYCRCAMFLSQFISQFQLSWFISGFCSFNQTFVQYSQSFCNSASSVAISLDRVLISFLRFRSSCRNMSSPIYLFLSSWSSSLASSYSISLVIDISYWMRVSCNSSFDFCSFLLVFILCPMFLGQNQLLDVSSVKSRLQSSCCRLVVFPWVRSSFVAQDLCSFSILCLLLIFSHIV